MNTGNDKIIGMMGSAVIAAMTLLVAAGAASLLSALVRIGPRVGDIIAFDPLRYVRADPKLRLLATRSAAFACVLDLDTIGQSGGSMILEARLSGDTRGFFLHWAGDRTSSDAADCGKSADLIVDQRDMDVLILAAGGNGVGGKLVAAVTKAVPF